jgi:hypothetical protein
VVNTAIDWSLWRDVPGYEGRYLVNANGDVMSLKILSHSLGQRRKNPRVRLIDHKDKGKQIQVAKLIEMAWGVDATVIDRSQP